MTETLDKHFRHSSYREKLVEHLFVGELLRFFWRRNIFDVSVLKPEVDNTGYDIVLARGSFIRHVQLKCSLVKASASGQKINSGLSTQPSGCIIWIVVDDSLNLVKYRWFGNDPGHGLPDLGEFPVAKHVKGNAMGEKKLRPNIRKIPKSRFSNLASLEEIVDKLFGPLKNEAP